MSVNTQNTYDVDSHMAEIYDQLETQTDDVELIRSLLGGRGPLRILEPFCGNGRILIPLALDGHTLMGMDQSTVLLESARKKIAHLPQEVQERIRLTQADVTACTWPEGFDLVVLGGNCLYELATPDEQERCIASAAATLESGGYIYVDNDHMEGELGDSWRQVGVKPGKFPRGTCADGTQLDCTTETIWYDAPLRLVRFRRTVMVTRPDGETHRKEWLQQKHPPSTGEVRTWLENHGFAIERLLGDREGNEYQESSPRAIFWARNGEDEP
jgi:SAM-dependent methyltransferase